MINDYSEILAELPAKTVKLQNALRDKKWIKAHVQVLDIARDMIKLAGWLLTKHEKS